MNDLAKKNWAGRLMALFIAGLLFEVMTSATFLWYRDKRLYVDQWGCPVRRQGPDWSELTLLKKGEAAGGPTDPSDFAVPSDVTHVFGGYWDVYRIAFLVRRACDRRPVSLVSQSIPRVVSRVRAWSRETVGLASGKGFEEVGNEDLRGSRGWGRSIGARNKLAVGARDVLGKGRARSRRA